MSTKQREYLGSASKDVLEKRRQRKIRSFSAAQLTQRPPLSKPTSATSRNNSNALFFSSTTKDEAIRKKKDASYDSISPFGKPRIQSASPYLTSYTTPRNVSDSKSISIDRPKLSSTRQRKRSHSQSASYRLRSATYCDKFTTLEAEYRGSKHGHRVMYTFKQDRPAVHRVETIFTGLFKNRDIVELKVKMEDDRCCIILERNGIVDEKWSACCGFGFTVGRKLGGSTGHFVLLSVSGQKCIECSMKERNQELSKYLGWDTDSTSSKQNDDSIIVEYSKEMNGEDVGYNTMKRHGSATTNSLRPTSSVTNNRGRSRSGKRIDNHARLTQSARATTSSKGIRREELFLSARQPKKGGSSTQSVDPLDSLTAMHGKTSASSPTQSLSPAIRPKREKKRKGVSSTYSKEPSMDNNSISMEGFVQSLLQNNQYLAKNKSQSDSNRDRSNIIASPSRKTRNNKPSIVVMLQTSSDAENDSSGERDSESPRKPSVKSDTSNGRYKKKSQPAARPTSSRKLKSEATSISGNSNKQSLTKYPIAKKQQTVESKRSSKHPILSPSRGSGNNGTKIKPVTIPSSSPPPPQSSVRIKTDEEMVEPSNEPGDNITSSTSTNLDSEQPITRKDSSSGLAAQSTMINIVEASDDSNNDDDDDDVYSQDFSTKSPLQPHSRELETETALSFGLPTLLNAVHTPTRSLSPPNTDIYPIMEESEPESNAATPFHTNTELYKQLNLPSTNSLLSSHHNHQSFALAALNDKEGDIDADIDEEDSDTDSDSDSDPDEGSLFQQQSSSRRNRPMSAYYGKPPNPSHNTLQLLSDDEEEDDVVSSGQHVKHSGELLYQKSSSQQQQQQQQCDTLEELLATSDSEEEEE